MNLVLLTATLLALLSGPLLYAWAHRRPAFLAFLDGFVLVAIGGLVFMEVLPETLEAGGAWALAFLAAGALGPTLFEHQLHDARRAHVAALLLAIAGLVLHSVGDGTALAPQTGDHPRMALALAIALHSVPVGLAVWWLLYPVFGALLPSVAIGAMCAGTVAGYAFAGDLGGWLGDAGWAQLQALVAGSILHVVFGRPHLEETSGHRDAPPRFEGLGNLVALGALVFLETLDPPSHHSHPEFLDRFVDLGLAAAPGLLAAYLVAALIGRRRDTPPPPEARGPRALWHGVLLGLRAAIVSDEPVAWHRRVLALGVPATAALSGLILLCELPLTALLVSLPLLGWQLSLLRAWGVLLLVLVVGRVVARALPAQPLPRFHAAPALASGGGLLQPAPGLALRKPAPAEPALARLYHSLTERLDSSAPWVITGLLVASWATPFLQEQPWAPLPALLQPGVFALLGLLLAASAAGATPLAAALLVAGASPGAALAFLLGGAAAHPGMILRLREVHGSLPAAGIAAAVIAVASFVGYAVDTMPAAAAAASTVAAGIATHNPLQWLCAAVLAALLAASLLRRGGRSFFGSLFPFAHVHHHH